jgi:ATP-dependent Clp protease ATP-binding subunit ClpA
MLSPHLEKTLHRALSLAAEFRHEYATLEHLLLALTEDPDALAVLRGCRADVGDLRNRLEEYLTQDLDSLVTRPGTDPQPTTGFQRVLQRAVIHVQSAGREDVTGANILVALFHERESQAVYFLHALNISRLDVVNYLSHGIAKTRGGDSSGADAAIDEETGEKTNVKKGREALEAYCVNLNKKAADGKIDALIGRESEVERTIQILCRRQKNNPLYVGDPGVAKRRLPKASPAGL